jgi:DNA-directed RNA polymerase subunit beta'
MVENGEKIKAGKVLVKIPRRSSKSGDITGGLPKLLKLEARNPSTVVSEIDGVVSFGKLKEVTVRLLSNLNLVMLEYLVKLSSQILVQENDFVRAGVPLSDGAITQKIF